MIIIIYSLLIFLNIVAIYLEKKILLLEIIIISLIIFLIGRGSLTPDTENYFEIYELSKIQNYNETYEKGYLLIQKISHYFNLNYVQFRIIVVAISFTLISITLRKLNVKSSVVYLTYSLFLIFIDNEQIRNFLAFSLVIYSINYIINNKNNSKYLFLFIIIIASTIHISALFYLILLLFNLRNKKIISKIIIIVTLFVCTFLFFNKNDFFLVRFLLEYIDKESNRLGGYIDEQTNYGFLYAFLLHLLNLFVVYYFKKNIFKRNKALIANNKSDYKIYNLVEFIYYINLISIIFFPLYMFNLQFIRLSRNLIIFNLIVFSCIFNYKNIPKVSSIFLIILYLFSWFYFSFIIQDHIKDIIIPFFQIDNIIE